MKKILLFVIALASFTCAHPQYTMVGSMYETYEAYQDAYTEGNYADASVLQAKLARANNLYSSYVGAAAEGRSGMMDSCKTAFDALYSRTHAVPSLTFSASSYLILDSLSLDGGTTYVTYLTDTSYVNTKLGVFWDTLTFASHADTIGILATEYDLTSKVAYPDTVGTMATEYDLVSKTAYSDTVGILATEYDIVDVVNNADTVGTIATEYDIVDVVNNADTVGTIATEYDLVSKVAFSDTVGTIATEYDLTQISATSADSSYYWIDVEDSISLGSQTIYNSVVGAEKRQVFTDDGGLGVGYVFVIQYAGTQKGAYINGGAGIYPYASPTTPTVEVYDSDPNTGLAWVSADKLGFLAGGVSTLTSEYNSSLGKSITKVTDSLYTAGGIRAAEITVDSINSGSQWVENIMGFNANPSSLSVRTISDAGIQSFSAVTDLTDAVYDSSEVWGGDDQYLKIYNDDLVYYDTVTIEVDSSAENYSTDYIDITNANLLAGDTIMLIAAPGDADQSNILLSATLQYICSSCTQYTSGGYSYIYTYDQAGTTAVKLDSIPSTFFTSATSGAYDINPGSHAVGLNQSIWLDLPDFDTGTGTGKIIADYKRRDFSE